MAKRNKHGRFIVSKDGYLYDTYGYGCSTWGSYYQETIQFRCGKYYIESCNLRAEIVDTGEEYITEFEIEVVDVLQKFEEIGKKYLESIIIPFKDRVEYIKKQKGVNRNSINPCYHIVIMLKSAVNNYAMETIVLPYFKSESKMYEGMNLNKEYTLKELGL